MESTWKASLIKILVETDAIRNLVGWRVYAAQLAAVDEPTFPCINFEVEGGTIPYRNAPFSIFTVRFWFYTETSIGDANALYELADAVLRCTAIVGGNNSTVLDPGTTPTEIEEPNLYAVTVSYIGRGIHV